MPGGKGNIRPEDNPKPFKKGVVTNPNGRPKKLVNYINNELKEQGFTPVANADVIDAYQTLINLPFDTIKNISAGTSDEYNDYPFLYRLVAKELLGKRGGEYLEKLLDRAYGKPKQSISVEGELTIPLLNIDPLSITDASNNGTKEDIGSKKED